MSYSKNTEETIELN